MKTFYFLLAILILTACGSSKKSLESGDFVNAVDRSVKNLRKKPTNSKEIAILNEAYAKANQIDIDRINFLRQGAEEQAWDEIFNRYNYLQERQNLVGTLPQNVLAAINFEKKEYTGDLFAAKKRACDFLYARAMRSLSTNDKYKAREAFYDLQRVKGYSPDYKDIDMRMGEAQFKGTNQILFKIKNESNIALPRDLEADILKISLKDLNVSWLNYDTKAERNINYDYYIVLVLKGISITPEQVNESSITDEKEIEDGYKYLLDSKGNVKKDTAGNDIKLPVYKKITCKVVTVRQFKACNIVANLDYVDARNGQLVKTSPVAAEMIFENRAATAVGDLDALKPESKQWLGKKTLPFPSNEQMIYDGGMVLKDRTKDYLWNNRNWLKN